MPTVYHNVFLTPLSGVIFSRNKHMLWDYKAVGVIWSVYLRFQAEVLASAWAH